MSKKSKKVNIRWLGRFLPDCYRGKTACKEKNLKDTEGSTLFHIPTNQHVVILRYGTESETFYCCPVGGGLIIAAEREQLREI